MKLNHPIKVGKIDITALNFRDYTTAGDYLAFDRKGGVAQTIALIASLAGTEEEVIMKLHGSDYQRAKAYADELLAKDDQEAAGSGEEAAEKK